MVSQISRGDYARDQYNFLPSALLMQFGKTTIVVVRHRRFPP